MIPDQLVKIKWTARVKKYYEQKGYIFTKMEDEFQVSLNDLSQGSRANVLFQCDYCLGENQIIDQEKYRPYKALLATRKPINKDCCSHMDCRTKKFTESRNLGIASKIENTLGFKFPDLISEWSKKNEKDPFQYSYGSDIVVWWIGKCGHEWDAEISKRTISKYGCPYCNGKRICLENCLQTNYPDIAEEWHPSKNGDITPYDVFKSDSREFWWKCKFGHEWKATVNSRFKNGNRIECPYCCNRKASLDTCLATINPELSNEWNFDKNEISPYDVTPQSGKKVWWKCIDCENEWEAKIQNRTLGNNCPVCSKSKGEKRIREWLINNNIIFEPQKEFDGLIGTGRGNLSYDFYLSKQNILIEYQGEFHDGSSGEYSKVNLEKQQEHDRRKRKYAEQNNINLLEIWYWDFNNIEEILENEIL